MNRVLSLAVLCALAMPAVAAQQSPDEQIARELDGRVAGPPVDCVLLRDIRSNSIIERTAILYEMRDGTIYLNRPASGAVFLRRDLVLVTENYSDRLCNIDIVRLYDPVGHIANGTVGLGSFVPYRKADRPQR